MNTWSSGSCAWGPAGRAAKGSSGSSRGVLDPSACRRRRPGRVPSASRDGRGQHPLELPAHGPASRRHARRPVAAHAPRPARRWPGRRNTSQSSTVLVSRNTAGARGGGFHLGSCDSCGMKGLASIYSPAFRGRLCCALCRVTSRDPPDPGPAPWLTMGAFGAFEGLAPVGPSDPPPSRHGVSRRTE